MSKKNKVRLGYFVAATVVAVSWGCAQRINAELTTALIWLAFGINMLYDVKRFEASKEEKKND